MSFVAAMNQPEHFGVGVNGSDVYIEAGVGDNRVVFYTSLVRDLPASEINRFVSKLLQESDEVQRDVVVMAFQTRDIRGGKGERDLFTHYIVSILQTHPEWADELLRLVPTYGAWFDLWKVWKECKNDHIEQVIDTIVKEQFTKDLTSDQPSLLAKWLPREGSKYDALAYHFAHLLFPDVGSEQSDGKLRAYRKAVADLNRKLATTEINMCGQTWSKIQPDHVPGRLLKRCKSAFLNTKKNGESRYIDNEDRNECHHHFEKYAEDLKTGKVTSKGGDTVMPHELVHEILLSNWSTPNPTEETMRQGQWDAIRQTTHQSGGLGKCVFMCDFSGSMDGTPKEVSLALGILGSECASEVFKDHILTFDSKPVWHSFKGMTNLRQKVQSIGRLGQGLGTDFQAACDLILKRLVQYSVPASEAPTDLIVLTDMGFNEATNGGYAYNTKNHVWQTHFTMIRDAFTKLGYVPPRIVCWNLRAEYKDYHARAHEVGVVQLSGWSPSAFKAITTNGVTIETPYQGMRRILDDPRYDPVRDAFGRLKK